MLLCARLAGTSGGNGLWAVLLGNCRKCGPSTFRRGLFDVPEPPHLRRPQYYKPKFSFVPRAFKRYFHQNPRRIVWWTMGIFLFAASYGFWEAMYRIYKVGYDQWRLEAEDFVAKGMDMMKYGENIPIPFTGRTFDIDPRIRAMHQDQMARSEPQAEEARKRIAERKRNAEARAETGKDNALIRMHEAIDNAWDNLIAKF